MRYTIITIITATALVAAIYFFGDNRLVALVIGNIIGLYIGERIVSKIGLKGDPAHLNWVHGKHDFELLLQTANHELQKYARTILLNPKTSTIDVVNWPAPPETVITEGLEYKWIGIKKGPDFQEYLRNHTFNK